MNVSDARAKLEEMGQAHLLKWFDELGDMEQEAPQFITDRSDIVPLIGIDENRQVFVSCLTVEDHHDDVIGRVRIGGVCDHIDRHVKSSVH